MTTFGGAFQSQTPFKLVKMALFGGSKIVQNANFFKNVTFRSKNVFQNTQNRALWSKKDAAILGKILPKCKSV
jgi:hypothetical protein